MLDKVRHIFATLQEKVDRIAMAPRLEIVPHPEVVRLEKKEETGNVADTS
jgi:hypothetical protein